MGYSSRKIKDRAIELEENYQEARDDDFNASFRAFLRDHGDDPLDEEDIKQMLDGFDADWPDPMDWAFDQVQSELDDIGDQKHEEARDRRMGID